MSRHTPGKWLISEPKYPDIRQIEDRLIYAVVNSEKLHVAEVYQYQNDNNREANGTALANAHLIAQSPLMYDYISQRADNGDTEAQKIISQINA